MIQTLVALWRVLVPFHSTFYRFIGLMALYEGMQIVEGYTLTLAIKLFQSQAELYWWIILFAVLLPYDELFARIDNRVDWHVSIKHIYEVYRHIKIRALAKFLEMGIPWHNARNSGTLVGKVSDGTWKILELIGNLSWEFIPIVIQTLLSLIPILYFSPLTGLVALTCLAIFVALALKAHKEKHPFQAARHDHYDEEWRRGVETVQAVETVQMFGQQERLSREFRQVHDQILETGRDEGRIGLFKYTRWQIRTITYARRLVLLIWIWQLNNGLLDIATLFFVSSLSERLFSNIWRFVRIIDRVSESMEAVNRLNDLLSQPSQRRVGKPVPEEAKKKLDIVLEDVNFAYGSEYTEEEGALHNFSLEIPFGSKVALVGPSGAGKTTIQKIVTGKYPIQSGSIQVGGIDVHDWPEEELLSQFAHVPQGDDVNLMSGTIGYNIAFPKTDTPLKEVIAAAKLAGIHSFIESLPDGYETLIGEKGKRLSGGQKQRVALARAILSDRPVFILDEATSAVDARTERVIQSQMEEILSGKTAVIIAHRLSTIWNLADKIVVMDDGRKVEEGAHEELMGLRGLYYDLVMHQTRED